MAFVGVDAFETEQNARSFPTKCYYKLPDFVINCRIYRLSMGESSLALTVESKIELKRVYLSFSVCIK